MPKGGGNKKSKQPAKKSAPKRLAEVPSEPVSVRGTADQWAIWPR